MRKVSNVDQCVLCLNCSIMKGKPDVKKTMINPALFLKDQDIVDDFGYITGYILLKCPDCGKKKMNPVWNKTDVWVRIQEKKKNERFKKKLKGDFDLNEFRA